ncbi:MAG: hypothetical protein Q9204_005322 [Flavoplaca sp. TL-2023a]
MSIQHNDALRPRKPLLRYTSVHFYRPGHEQLISTVSILLVNAVAILSEDRFLARIGWGSAPTEPAFGGSRDEAASVKGKLVNLISSVRTLMRSELIPRLSHILLLPLSE